MEVRFSSVCFRLGNSRFEISTEVCNSEAMKELRIKGKLVDAQELLNELFSDGCRPSLRWLRTQTKAKTIPHIKIAHLIFFDVEMVRVHLAGARLVRSRWLPMRHAAANGG